MSKDTENTILELYDKAYHKKAQIKSLAAMYGCTEDEIRDVLVRNGRIKPEKIKKASDKTGIANDSAESKLQASEETAENTLFEETHSEAKSEEEQVTDVRLPMPAVVREIISKELDRLDSEIEYHKREYERLSAQFKIIADYMK